MFVSKFNCYLPKEWTDKTISSLTIKKLPATDPTYIKYFSSTGDNFNNKIIEIFEIENPFLYYLYQIKKEEYRSRGCLQEKELYHCTSMSNMKLIAKNNFDRRFVNRAKFGLGVSFSPSPSYANKQANFRIGLDRAMIVADVLVCNTCEGSKYLKLPKGQFDTTTGNSNNVFVKYYDNEFYPKYVAHYRV